MRLVILIFMVSVNCLFSQSDSLKVVQIHKPQNFYLGSGAGSIIGDNDKIVLDVILPQGTLKWYYVISATRNEANVNKVKSQLRLFSKITKAVDKTGLTESFLNVVAAPPSEDICNVFHLTSFEAGREFESAVLMDKRSFFTDGSRKRYKSGVVEISNPKHCKGNQYLGIENISTLYGLNVVIEVVAVVTEEWDSKVKQKFYNLLLNQYSDNYDYIYLTSDDVSKLVNCITSKFMNNNKPNDINNLAEYEAIGMIESYENECFGNLKLEKKRLDFLQKKNEGIKDADLVGLWKDENSQFEFFEDNSFHIKWDSGMRKKGKWSYSNDVLWISFGKKSNFVAHEILNFEKFKMTYKTKDSNDVFNANKIR